MNRALTATPMTALCGCCAHDVLLLPKSGGHVPRYLHDHDRDGTLRGKRHGSCPGSTWTPAAAMKLAGTSGELVAFGHHATMLAGQKLTRPFVAAGYWVPMDACLREMRRAFSDWLGRLDVVDLIAIARDTRLPDLPADAAADDWRLRETQS